MTDFNKDKFKELMLYIAQRSVDDPKFGATKLNKILFFSDFMFYAESGESVTGATYQRLNHGPAPRELLPVQKELEADDEGFLHRTGLGGRQKRLLALRDPILSVFAPEEIAMIDEIIWELKPYNATEVSGLSHLLVGWEIAADREIIPYESVFLSSKAPTMRDIERGIKLATEHGLAA